MLARTGVHDAVISPQIPESHGVPEWDDEVLIGEGHDLDDDVVLMSECYRLAEIDERKQRQRAQTLAEAIEKTIEHTEPVDTIMKKRVFHPVPATGISAAAANKLLPPGAKLSKDTSRENRWRLRCKSLGSERTKAYGAKSPLDDRGAMIFLIKLSWAAYTRKSGVECPHTFDEM
eukprot:6476776-Amphidinium_carterae.2